MPLPNMPTLDPSSRVTYSSSAMASSGRVHRNDRGRGHAVAQVAEVVRGDDVVGANHRAPGVVVADARHAQAGGRVDDREVGAELVEPLVEQARHHRGGAIERVLRLAAPEGGLGDAPAPPLGDRHAQRIARGLHGGEEAVGGLVAADLAHPLAEDGVEFDPVAVAVDDRMFEARADLCRRSMAVSSRMPPPTTGVRRGYHWEMKGFEGSPERLTSDGQVAIRAYGSRRDPLRRVCLDATRLEFVHPHGRRVVFESPPPWQFRLPESREAQAGRRLRCFSRKPSIFSQASAPCLGR